MIVMDNVQITTTKLYVMTDLGGWFVNDVLEG